MIPPAEADWLVPKFRITASCGHKISDEWFHGELSIVTVKSFMRDGSRGIACGVYCAECRSEAEESGELLTTDAAILAWQAGESRAPSTGGTTE